EGSEDPAQIFVFKEITSLTEPSPDPCDVFSKMYMAIIYTVYMAIIYTVYMAIIHTVYMAIIYTVYMAIIYTVYMAIIYTVYMAIRAITSQLP
ncbi:hypothetical protein STEG23_003161, partial [Scotinomys teguina]